MSIVNFQTGGCKALHCRALQYWEGGSIQNGKAGTGLCRHAPAGVDFHSFFTRSLAKEKRAPFAVLSPIAAARAAA
jgi:hypothetical protein